jgi:hypothetical protein
MNNKEKLEESTLRQLFKNRSNCYVNAEDVIQAMDEDCFIETIKEWKREQDKKIYNDKKELIEVAMELYHLVHESDLILNKIRANELYDDIEKYKNK